MCACRDDLEKQREASQKLASQASQQLVCCRAPGAVPAACSSVRRLPSQHRGLLVGWMRDVTNALRLQLSTLFCATSMLDRFVAASEVGASCRVGWVVIGRRPSHLAPAVDRSYHWGKGAVVECTCKSSHLQPYSSSQTPEAQCPVLHRNLTLPSFHVQALPADGLLQLLALTCMSVAVKYNEVRQICGPLAE